MSNKQEGDDFVLFFSVSVERALFLKIKSKIGEEERNCLHVLE
jgi:hypothetical protein